MAEIDVLGLASRPPCKKYYKCRNKKTIQKALMVMWHVLSLGKQRLSKNTTKPKTKYYGKE